MLNLYNYFSNPKKLLGYNERVTIVPILAYQKCIVDGTRDPTLEKTILKDPWLAYKYSNNMINGRWPEAEQYLFNNNPEVCYLYAKNIIKGKWEEAEHVIKQDRQLWKVYNKKIANNNEEEYDA